LPSQLVLFPVAFEVEDSGGEFFLLREVVPSVFEGLLALSRGVRGPWWREGKVVMRNEDVYLM
jgi:hypothetical protein